MRKTLLVLALLALPVLLSPPAARAADEVYVYNWTEYIPEGVIEQFTEETGIKVVYTTYDSNEAMYAKLKMLGSKGYDVVFPSTYFVTKMTREGMLQKLDRAKLANYGNLNPALLGKDFDPKNEYSVPYAYGGTGIMVNTDEVPEGAVTSWRDLWKPEFKGRLLLQDDVREVLGLGLILNGYSVNSTSPAEIKKAYETMETLVPSVRVFNSDNPRMPFLNEEVGVGMIWSGEAYQAHAEAGNFRFFWPREGGMFWMDCMCIPAGAANVENAYKFIDFLLRPDVAAKFSEEIGYATANKAALELLPKELREDATFFPPDTVLGSAEFQNDVGDAIVTYEEYWNKLKAGQ